MRLRPGYDWHIAVCLRGVIRDAADTLLEFSRPDDSNYAKQGSYRKGLLEILEGSMAALKESIRRTEYQEKGDKP